MSDAIVGNCTTDPNPDWWFHEIPNGGHQPTMLKRIAPEVQYALNLCKTCPKKEVCLKEGMKQENIVYGIWGGVLAGDRVKIAQDRGDDIVLYRTERNAAKSFATNIRPYLEE